MARKKIREHDGKRLLKKHLARIANINLPLNSVLVDCDTDFRKVANENPWVLNHKLVAKVGSFQSFSGNLTRLSPTCFLEREARIILCC